MPDFQDDPPKFEHVGPEWFKEWVEELRTWMIEHRIVPGLNCSMSDTPGGGKRIDVEVGAKVLLKPFPFQVSISGKSYKVNPGTINNLVPSGLSTLKTFKEGDFVLLDVTTDGNKVIRAAVIAGTVPATPDCIQSSAPTNFQVPLAILAKEGVQQIVFTNLAAVKVQCNQTEKAYPIAPIGSSPWINWFTWAVVPELTPQLFPV